LIATAAVLLSLAQAAPAPATPPAPAADPGRITAERLVRARSEPHNWLTYSGSYDGQRHAPLAEIDTGNVARLQPAWIYQAREFGKAETSPIVIDGILYITERSQAVTALDGRTGRPLWSFARPRTSRVPTCCGDVNRGLAALDDALYLATLDAHLIALDRRTGGKRWDVTVADFTSGHSLTLAPLAVKDKIIVGISGGEFGVRGFIDAYDARTGKRLWRFWTIPAPGEPGHDSWPPGNAWKTGGAPAWVTGSYDPALNLLYWGTGNPAPDYNGDVRRGDNLYTDCIVALDADTGKLRWYFQYTPHDMHDWDSNQVPVLIDGEFPAGRPRKLLAQANRNAFFYLLDRQTGEFLLGAPFARQSWAKGLDPRGRPVRLPGTEPSDAGTKVFPGLAGATNWQSPTYSPQTRLFYVTAREDYAQVFYKHAQEFRAGGKFEGGAARDVEGSEHFGVVKAIDPLTARVRWEFKLHAAPTSGLLSTAGGLLFGGTREGWFFALDARTGKPLWRFQTGGTIWANPVSYTVDGRQQVAVAAGHGLFVFALPQP
jgi:alcohol dehydrogenase (cytochrome c)